MAAKPLDFMVIGLPRSGTTWLANLLCTDEMLCFHDPLYTVYFEDWDVELRKRTLPETKVGIACTGIWMWPEWVNAHPARKVVIHRAHCEILQSMGAVQAPTVGLEEGEKCLAKIQGMHVEYSALFLPDTARAIWQYLTRWGSPFPEARHRLLVDMNVQPQFEKLEVDADVSQRLFNIMPAVFHGG